MWITRLKIRHDCIIGNRCKQFKVTTTGTPFNVFFEKGVTYAPQIQTVQGDEERINSFIKDLRKDKRITNFEVEGSTVFFIEVRKEKIPSTFYHSKLIFVKPVFVDKEGYEYWEVATWKKTILTDFINGIKKEVSKDITLLKMKESKLTDIYYSHLMPQLTENQHKALLLAFEGGYYNWPKKTDLGRLAKIMKISIATFREHLKKAEQKIMPNLIETIQK